VNTLPSIELKTYPCLFGKQLRHLVWYFNEDSRFCCTKPILRISHTQTFRLAVPTTSFSPAKLMVYTLSGCVYVPVQEFDRASQIFTVESQLPVTTAFISLLNSIHLMVLSCIPTTDSWFELISKDFNFPSRHPDQTWIGSWNAQANTGLWKKAVLIVKWPLKSNCTFWENESSKIYLSSVKSTMKSRISTHYEI